MWGLVWIGIALIVLGVFIGNLVSDEREARRNADRNAQSGHKRRKVK